jgi:hypothetical protein
LLPILPLFILCGSCDGFFVSESSIQSVTVSPTAILIEAAPSGDTFTLVSTAMSVGGTQTDDTATATWSSSPANVVTVAAGLVTATATTANQTTAVTSKDSGVTSNPCNVLTYTGTISTVTIATPNGTSIAPGSSLQLAASYNSLTTPNIASFVTWTPSDSTVATVNANGLVTLVGTPTVVSFTVTATANLGTAATTRTVTSLPVTINIT